MQLIANLNFNAGGSFRNRYSYYPFLFLSSANIMVIKLKLCIFPDLIIKYMLFYFILMHISLSSYVYYLILFISFE